MFSTIRKTILAGVAGVAFAAVPASAQELIISTGLGQPHMWVAHHMDPFIERIQEATNGEITFTPFYAGELTPVGRELDGLNSGSIHVAAPLLAPYHEGRFPLSDITQLPTYNTDSPMVTRAFQAMLDSDVELADGKTFREYEIDDKNIKVWALGATAAYSISTTGKELKEPADFRGTPLRAGSAIHTIFLEQVGSTPVTMPGSAAYEALSRDTIEGLIIAISDWPSYSIEQLLRYSITDVAIGHWESYLAVSNDAWEMLSDEQKKIFDEVARQLALDNAEKWESTVGEVVEKSKADDDGKFVPVTELSQEMQDHIAKTSANTWIAWIEQAEANGHPARAAAKLYAELITAEGGELPEGVAEYLED
ncbi:MAG: hypothetical protein K5872_22625 [Rhizobiaceae bacterium]|nr:hypothetical protein [Rhizobiaceae bacterium]MCV0409018.1 hypothetical protein [Rhizobiaceae bacterium]